MTAARARVVAVLLLGIALGGSPSAADPATLPRITSVVAPARLRVGAPGEMRLGYRAPGGNVVAVSQVIDDLDGPPGRRSTSQREFGVLARAFGLEAGELTVPLAFGSPGWKRVTVTLVTDEREESDPVVVEVEALP